MRDRATEIRPELVVHALKAGRLAPVAGGDGVARAVQHVDGPPRPRRGSGLRVFSSSGPIWAGTGSSSAARRSTSRVSTKGSARNLSRLLRSRAALIWLALRASWAARSAPSRAQPVARCSTAKMAPMSSNASMMRAGQPMPGLVAGGSMRGVAVESDMVVRFFAHFISGLCGLSQPGSADVHWKKKILVFQWVGIFCVPAGWHAVCIGKRLSPWRVRAKSAASPCGATIKR